MSNSFISTIAVIFGLSIALFIAYWAYLLSSESTYELEIQQISNNILDEYETFSEDRPLMPVDILFLFDSYKNDYPNKSEQELIIQIQNDLLGVVIFKNENIKTELEEKLDARGMRSDRPYYGRIFFSLLERSIKCLLPKLPGKKSFSFGYFQQGPVGSNLWLDEYSDAIKEVRKFISIREFYDLSDDLVNYFNIYFADTKRKVPKVDVYNKWLDNVEYLIDFIDSNFRKIQSIENTARLYSIEKRISSYFWIFLCSMIAFFIGVLIPLFLEIIDKHPPTLYKIGTYFTTLAFLFISIALFVSDVKNWKNRVYASDYKQMILQSLKEHKNEYPYVVALDIEPVNRVVQQMNAIGFKSILLDRITEYGSYIERSNKCSLEISGRIEEMLVTSKEIKDLEENIKKDNKNISYSIMLPLHEGNIEKLIKNLKLDRVNFGIMRKTRKSSKNVVMIALGSNETQNKLGIEKIKDIYDEISKSKEWRSCIKKREEADRLRNKLINKYKL